MNIEFENVVERR